MLPPPLRPHSPRVQQRELAGLDESTGFCFLSYIRYYDFTLNPPPQLKIAEKSQAPSSRDMRSGRHPSIVPGAPKGLDADGDADDYLQNDF